MAPGLQLVGRGPRTRRIGFRGSTREVWGRGIPVLFLKRRRKHRKSWCACRGNFARSYRQNDSIGFGERGRRARRFRPLAENTRRRRGRKGWFVIVAQSPVGATPTGATGTIALPVFNCIVPAHDMAIRPSTRFKILGARAAIFESCVAMIKVVLLSVRSAHSKLMISSPV